jgi:4-hydroxy-3-methylbut-2-enyl diphosphate reductase
MEIKLAKYAGFCCGVNKAVNAAFSLSCKEPVYTLGELIHNSQIMDALERKGIKKIDSIDALKEGDCVIIRAHGVGKQVYDELDARKVKYLMPLVRMSSVFIE